MTTKAEGDITNSPPEDLCEDSGMAAPNPCCIPTGEWLASHACAERPSMDSQILEEGVTDCHSISEQPKPKPNSVHPTTHATDIAVFDDLTAAALPQSRPDLPGRSRGIDSQPGAYALGTIPHPVMPTNPAPTHTQGLADSTHGLVAPPNFGDQLPLLHLRSSSGSAESALRDQ